jgi:hypothetical protein
VLCLNDVDTLEKKFEDRKEVIRSRKSKTRRPHITMTTGKRTTQQTII